MNTDPTSLPDGHGQDGDKQSTGHSGGFTGTSIEELYNKHVATFEDRIQETNMRKFQRDMANRFPHHGFTLDLGCGAGPIGMLIHQSLLNSAGKDSSADPNEAAKEQPNVYIHGVDISSNMLKQPWCEHYYDSTQKALIQDILLDPTGAWTQHIITDKAHEHGLSTSDPMVDHITCFGALHFLNPTQFDAALRRMFSMARRSVSFDVDDLSPAYIDQLVERHGEGFRNYNHVAAYREFGTPRGWTKVVEEEGVIYHSRNVGVDVGGVLVRFERDEGVERADCPGESGGGVVHAA